MGRTGRGVSRHQRAGHERTCHGWSVSLPLGPSPNEEEGERGRRGRPANKQQTTINYRGRARNATPKWVLAVRDRVNR